MRKAWVNRKGATQGRMWLRTENRTMNRAATHPDRRNLVISGPKIIEGCPHLLLQAHQVVSAIDFIRWPQRAVIKAGAKGRQLRAGKVFCRVARNQKSCLASIREASASMQS